MKKLIACIFSLLSIQYASSQDPWLIKADKIEPSNYHGITAANGMIGNADGSRLLISNKAVNRLVHRWRSEEAAILVGTNTAQLDNPSLINQY